LGLPLCLVFMFGPAYVAACFFRCCLWLAHHGILERAGKQVRPRTRATRWLVRVGGCLIVASMMPGAAGMLMADSAVQTQTPPVAPESFHNLIS
jgi:hypothetical protein